MEDSIQNIQDILRLINMHSGLRFNAQIDRIALFLTHLEKRCEDLECKYQSVTAINETLGNKLKQIGHLVRAMDKMAQIPQLPRLVKEETIADSDETFKMDHEEDSGNHNLSVILERTEAESEDDEDEQNNETQNNDTGIENDDSDGESNMAKTYDDKLGDSVDKDPDETNEYEPNGQILSQKEYQPCKTNLNTMATSTPKPITESTERQTRTGFCPTLFQRIVFGTKTHQPINAERAEENNVSRMKTNHIRHGEDKTSDVINVHDNTNISDDVYGGKTVPNTGQNVGEVEQEKVREETQPLKGTTFKLREPVLNLVKICSTERFEQSKNKIITILDGKESIRNVGEKSNIKTEDMEIGKTLKDVVKLKEKPKEEIDEDVSDKESEKNLPSYEDISDDEESPDNLNASNEGGHEVIDLETEDSDEGEKKKDTDMNLIDISDDEIKKVLPDIQSMSRAFWKSRQVTEGTYLETTNVDFEMTNHPEDTDTSLEDPTAMGDVKAYSKQSTSVNANNTTNATGIPDRTQKTKIKTEKDYPKSVDLGTIQNYSISSLEESITSPSPRHERYSPNHEQDSDKHQAGIRRYYGPNNMGQTPFRDHSDNAMNYLISVDTTNEVDTDALVQMTTTGDNKTISFASFSQTLVPQDNSKDIIREDVYGIHTKDKGRYEKTVVRSDEFSDITDNETLTTETQIKEYKRKRKPQRSHENEKIIIRNEEISDITEDETITNDQTQVKERERKDVSYATFSQTLQPQDNTKDIIRGDVYGIHTKGKGRYEKTVVRSDEFSDITDNEMFTNEKEIKEYKRKKKPQKPQENKRIIDRIEEFSDITDDETITNDQTQVKERERKDVSFATFSQTLQPQDDTKDIIREDVYGIHTKGKGRYEKTVVKSDEFSDITDNEMFTNEKEIKEYKRKKKPQKSQENKRIIDRTEEISDITDDETITNDQTQVKERERKDISFASFSQTLQPQDDTKDIIREDVHGIHTKGNGRYEKTVVRNDEFSDITDNETLTNETQIKEYKRKRKPQRSQENDGMIIRSEDISDITDDETIRNDQTDVEDRERKEVNDRKRSKVEVHNEGNQHEKNKLVTDPVMENSLTPPESQGTKNQNSSTNMREKRRRLDASLSKSEEDDLKAKKKAAPRLNQSDSDDTRRERPKRNCAKPQRFDEMNMSSLKSEKRNQKQETKHSKEERKNKKEDKRLLKKT